MEQILNTLLALRENLFGMVKVLSDVRMALIDEGFDEESASKIVAAVMTATSNNQTKDED